LHPDAWDRWNESLEWLSQANTRTVLRVTLIRGYNDLKSLIPEFAELISRGSPHFIELKSYMHIGMSNQRLEEEQMLEMDEVQNFARELCNKLQGFEVMDESEISRIVVLQNKNRVVDRWIKEYTEAN